MQNQPHKEMDERRLERQHSLGKLSVWERIQILFDEGTFVEVDDFADGPGKYAKFGDGVVTGYGKINGRAAYISAQDFTIRGGTLGAIHAQKICRIMDMALAAKAPYISIYDGGGARIEEGVAALDATGGIFLRHTKNSGIIPQIACILGPCAGGACYSPALSDFIFMTEKTSQMFITGPAVVKEVIGEEISIEDLGGARIHEATSGVASVVYPDDAACLKGVRDLLQYLPQHSGEKPAVVAGEAVDASASLEKIVPTNPKTAYDVRDVITTFADKGSFFEIQKNFAKNVVVGLLRLDGSVVGVVANQPNWMAGALDVDASDKAARFVRFCDGFNIPLLSLVDVPGYMPGSKQEQLGIIRHGAKLLYAFSEAKVPKVTLVMRKAFGGAYVAMNSKNIGADYVYAWPMAQIAVMGAEGAVRILYKKELKAAAQPEKFLQEKTRVYEDKYLNPRAGVANGTIDEIIPLSTTRERLSRAFESLSGRASSKGEKSHGNIPL